MGSKGSLRQLRAYVAIAGTSSASSRLAAKYKRLVQGFQAQQGSLNSLMERKHSELEDRETELRLTWDEFELRVSERTVELEKANSALKLENIERRRVEAALITAKNAAEAASRAKDQFVRNMSHELRTPINGVLGMTEIMVDTDLTEEQQEYLAIVKESADSLLALVNNVLDHSAIEHQDLTLNPVLFNPAECLAELERETEAKSSVKGLALRFEAGPEMKTMLIGDCLRLKQVVTNLIDNAIKFTSRGSISVCASLRDSAADCVELLISVSDTGIGMTAEQQRQIFEAFSQADVSDTRQYGGMGLGLALSSQLVKLMGGQICAESEVGVGSKFSFSAVCTRPKVSPTI